ncbi:MAG TPA: T9SS type A sorting domain-containing protein [Chitinophagales bacterium]|nr:T9SS type A sorting domain-containing protein [Chitinophagales bacterium]
MVNKGLYGYSLLLFVFSTISSYGQAGLRLQTGAQLIINGSPEIVLNNCGLYNDGDIDAGLGAFRITGTAATSNSVIAGSSYTTFYDLTLQKLSNDMQMEQHCAITHFLTCDGGLLELNGYVIDLGTTGIIKVESEDTRVTGTSGGEIIATATLNAPSGANPGNLGASITSTANLGLTTVRRGHVQQTDPSGNYSIYRYYDISPTNNAGLNALLIQYYFDAENAGLDENNFDHYLSDNAGATWNNLGQDARDPTDNFVKLSGYDAFARQTLADPIGSPLPVVLIDFYAQCTLTSTVLNWSTASEINSDHFEIQQLDFNQNWVTISTIPAQGYASQTTNYTYSLPTSNTFYRLVLVSTNGDAEILEVIQSDCYIEPATAIYPNPTTDYLHIDFGNHDNAQGQILIYDMHSQLVQQLLLQENSGKIQIDVRMFPTGIYLLEIQEGKNNKHFLFNKQDKR